MQNSSSGLTSIGLYFSFAGNKKILFFFESDALEGKLPVNHTDRDTSVIHLDRLIDDE